jgi:mannose-1-phosphate guanylyltransferase
MSLWKALALICCYTIHAVAALGSQWSRYLIRQSKEQRLSRACHQYALSERILLTYTACEVRPKIAVVQCDFPWSDIFHFHENVGLVDSTQAFPASVSLSDLAANKLHIHSCANSNFTVDSNRPNEYHGALLFTHSHHMYFASPYTIFRTLPSGLGYLSHSPSW